MIAQKNIVLRATNLFWLGAVVVCGGIMFYVSLEARHAEEKLYRTYAEIKQEEENIKVLKAEIAYLTSPDRLQTLADQHLPLNDTNREQFASLDTLEERVSIMASTEIFRDEKISNAVKAMIDPSPTPVKPASEKDTQVASQVTRNTFNALLQKISNKQDN